MSSSLLFVYGTLLPEINHPMGQLLQENGELIGKGSTKGKLYDLGEYPGLREDSNHIVHGAVFNVLNPETWSELDWYEGCNNLPSDEYYKKEQHIQLEDGKAVFAWVYFFRPAIPESKCIQNGDYLKYLGK